MKIPKLNTTTKITLIAVILFVVYDFMFLTHLKISASKSLDMATLPVISAQDLSNYNGVDPGKPVYLALDGLVYDVSLGRADFYDPGQSYHYLVGKDSSRELHIFGASIIKNKYKVIGVYKP